MDDQQTYLLNGLLSRHFGLGRIVRFRSISRGRQAQTFELFTAQEKEYLAQLFPPTLSDDQLNFVARSVNALDANRFSVMPYLPAKTGGFSAEGPQNSHLMVSLAPVGSALAPADYSDHDVSQVGLRLAWMHRLLKEQLPPPANAVALADRFAQQFLSSEIAAPDHRQLHSLLALPIAQGWAHGDISPAALLHDADHQLRAITDWGLLHLGTPLEDLVDAFLFLAAKPDGTLIPSRGAILMEAYDSLIPIKRMPWTPIVAHWCAQRLLDQHANLRPEPSGVTKILLPNPERLATALASCL